MENILTEKGYAVIRNAVGNSSLTNCYLSYNLVIDKIRTHEIQCICYDSIILMIHRVDGVRKIYYFLENRNILFPEMIRKIQADLAEYPDLVGTVVWTAETAVTADLNDVYPLLQGISDVMTDHLVSREELHAFLVAQQVLKVVIGGELAGVLVFEIFGRKSYLRTVSVADRFIGKKVGFSLIQAYFEKNQNGTKLFYLWVESTNERAIRLYERLGYRDDGLTEYIYRKGHWD